MIPKVYEKEELVEIARQVTIGANASVTRRWKLPVFGKLQCVYAGAAEDVVTYKTPVRFRWTFSSQYANSMLTKTMPACDAQDKPQTRLLVPLPMRLPITCAYIGKCLGLTRALPVMQKFEDVNWVVYSDSG